MRATLAGALLTASSTFIPPQQVHALLQPFGDFNGVVSNGDQTVTGWGWVMTEDAPTASLGVRIYMSAPDIGLSGYVFPSGNYRLADVNRPDVGQAYPAYGPKHGFSFLIPIIFTQRVNLCLEALSYTTWFPIECIYDVYGRQASSSFNRFGGGLFPQVPNQVLTLTYYRPLWQADVDAGATAWNPATRVDFVPTTNQASAQVLVSITDLTPQLGAGVQGITGYVPWSTTATAAWADQGSLPRLNRTFSQNRVFLNTTGPQMTDPAIRRKTISHEFGHALGLAHPWNPGVGTVMHAESSFRSSAPMTFDLNSVNNAYTSTNP